MADAASSCSLISIRIRHENGRTFKGSFPRPMHRHGGISFHYDDTGVDNTPTPPRTQLMRTSTPVISVELDRGEASMRYTDRYGFVPPGSADPDRPKHFKQVGKEWASMCASEQWGAACALGSKCVSGEGQ